MPMSFSQWSCVVLLNYSFFVSLYPPVPIIPSYLYSLDESTDVPIRNSSPSQQEPSGSFHAVVSLYDNTVKLSGSNSTTRSTNLVPPTPAVTERSQNFSDCPQSTSKLLNENVKVGMLFASKATVQLMTNPFIGPLTNRYLSALLNYVQRRVQIMHVADSCLKTQTAVYSNL